MASIDELFKGVGSSKRRQEPLRDPNQVYKYARQHRDDPRRARVEDEAQKNPDDDIEAGPAAPDGDDEDGDYGPAPPDDEDGDDDEGRFFGGGVTAEQNEILDYVDGQDDNDAPAPSELDAAWLRKTALAFERRINKNAELRAKHADDPSRFIQSEVELDDAIRTFSSLADRPDLYPEFARLGCAASLVGLLAHDNTDIAITAMVMLVELTDDEIDSAPDEWDALVDAALEADVLGLVASNLRRLDETADETDRAGVYHALNVIENLCSRDVTADAVGAHDDLFAWLLQRIQIKETPDPVSQNKHYAAEVLAILVQGSTVNRRRLAARDAVDQMLQLVAPYRRHDPRGGYDETEFMENLFEALTCIVDEPEGKEKFVAAEGVELCLIMLKEAGRLGRLDALRLLDHAAGGGGPAAANVCMRVVEAGGLRGLFTFFMKMKGGEDKYTDKYTAEHLVGIFASMLRLLPGASAERIRTLAKFVEKEYEKLIKLVTLRRELAGRLEAVDADIRAERSKMSVEERIAMGADDWFSRRLDAGLFTLQSIDRVLAWLVAEDFGAKRKIKSLLAERDEGLDVIKSTLQEQLDGMDTEDDEGKDTREMLTALMQFLQ